MKNLLKAVLVITIFLGSSLVVSKPFKAQTDCDKVVAKDGSGQYSSIMAGVNALSSGQTLCVKNGKYEEELNLNKQNITVKNFPGHKPVIDGRYNRNLITNNGNNVTVADPTKGNYLPGNHGGKPESTNMIKITQRNIRFEGFIIQNIAGSAISISASDVTVANNSIYWIYGTAIKSNSPGHMVNIKVINNIALFASIQSLDPAYVARYKGQGQPDPSSGIVKFGNIDGGLLLQGNYFAYGMGEGINIGKNNDATADNPIIVERNVLHDSRHKIINTNDANHVHIRNNLAFSPDPTIMLGGRVAGGPFEILDEIGGNSHDVYFYNNITVNTEKNCFRIGGRSSTYKNIYIGFNTFIAGPHTYEACIKMREPHKVNGIFENNIVYARGGKGYIGTNGNMTFRNNLWFPTDKAPTGGMFGNGSIKVDPKLVNPDTKMQAVKFPGEQKGTYLNFSDVEFLPNGYQIEINANNYRLQNGSPAINAASQRTAVNGFMPPAEAYSLDFFGKARGNSPDIGAHESDGTEPPPPTNTPIVTPSPTETPTAEIICTEKRYIFDEEQALENSNVSYAINIEYPATGDKTVKLKDYYSSKLEIVEKPNYCQVKTEEGVLGISTVKDNSLIEVIMYGGLVLTPITALVLIYLNKKKVIKLDKELVIFGGIIIFAGLVILLISKKDLAPDDSSAEEVSYLECLPPTGTEVIEYKMKIIGAVGEMVTNEAELLTLNEEVLDSCGGSFEIEELDEDVEPTDELEDSPPPNSPTPTTIQGNSCGKADVNDDGTFTIGDFTQFAIAYGNGQNTCADKDVDYGPCGGRDVDRNGKLNINDFGNQDYGFAQRYTPKPSCSL